MSSTLDLARAAQLGARSEQMGFEATFKSDGSVILVRGGAEFFFAGGIVQALDWLCMQ